MCNLCALLFARNPKRKRKYAPPTAKPQNVARNDRGRFERRGKRIMVRVGSWRNGTQKVLGWFQDAKAAADALKAWRAGRQANR